MSYDFLATYRRKAATTTAVTVVPSISARARAARHRSSDTLMARIGLVAMSGGLNVGEPNGLIQQRSGDTNAAALAADAGHVDLGAGRVSLLVAANLVRPGHPESDRACSGGYQRLCHASSMDDVYTPVKECQR